MDWVAAGGVCLGFNLSFAHAPPLPSVCSLFFGTPPGALSLVLHVDLHRKKGDRVIWTIGGRDGL